MEFLDIFPAAGEDGDHVSSDVPLPPPPPCPPTANDDIPPLLEDDSDDEGDDGTPPPPRRREIVQLEVRLVLRCTCALC